MGSLSFHNFIERVANEPLSGGKSGMPGRINVFCRLPLSKRRTAQDEEGTKDSNRQPGFGHGSDCTCCFSTWNQLGFSDKGVAGA